MTDILNPETLRALREQTGWSQEQLANEALLHGRISKTQIARWETAKKPIRLRKNSRDILCKTFGVKWEVLTRPPEKRAEEGIGSAELKLNVRPRTLTAFELVRRIYRISREDIVELAPLLFLLTAQTSLEHRRHALEEAVSAVEKALGDAVNRAPYLSHVFGWPDPDEIAEEENAIEQRRVFDTYNRTDEELGSHFVDYLQKLLDDLPDDVIKGIPGKPVSAIWASSFQTTGYSFSTALLTHALRKFIPDVDDLVESPENLDDLVTAVEAGYPDLRTLLENHRNMSHEEFKDWVAPMIKHQVDVRGIFLNGL
jgi:transcriptional regulator with XRE-family HTH domain